MKFILLPVCVRALRALALVPADARGGGHGRGHYSSWPYYGGGRHTSSHGGTYLGAFGSSHRGGHYRNVSSGNRYGRHK